MRKLADELTIQEAADLMEVDVSTINRWRRLGSLPAKFKLNKHFVKKSSIAKIKEAMEKHGDKWRQKVEFTPAERFEAAPLLFTDRLLTVDSFTCGQECKQIESVSLTRDGYDKVRQTLLNVDDLAPKLSDPKSESKAESKSMTLAKIAKELERLQERDLAAQVALKAVALM